MLKENYKKKAAVNQATFLSRLKRDLDINKGYYMMLIPVLIYLIIFAYGPMYGALIAFKDYTPRLGILGSPWVGFKHFKAFMTSPYFGRVFKNTVVISVTNLLASFPAPIILALLLNEIQNIYFKKTVQTLSYLPHFISMVVVCSLIKIFTIDTGPINQLLVFISGGMYKPTTMLNESGKFLPIYVVSDVWQSMGWGSIIYLSALASIDTEQYEAARVDGAGRFRTMISITLPSLLPTIIIMLIIRVGSIINVGYEKILLLYNEATMDVADVISTYVYRRGLAGESGGNQWSYSTAVGLFNSIINFVLVIVTNKISGKISDISLW